MSKLLFGVMVVIVLGLFAKQVELANTLFSQVFEEDFDTEFSFYNTTSGLYIAENIELDGYEFDDGSPMLVHRLDLPNVKKDFIRSEPFINVYFMIRLNS